MSIHLISLPVWPHLAYSQFSRVAGARSTQGVRLIGRPAGRTGGRISDLRADRSEGAGGRADGPSGLWTDRSGGAGGP